MAHINKALNQIDTYFQQVENFMAKIAERLF